MDFFLKVKPFQFNKYKELSLSNLICYVIKRLKQEGLESSFSNIVVASFKLFPESFSLLGFPEYPNAFRVFNTLGRDCAFSHHYVTGGMSKGWSLTFNGESVSTEVEEYLLGNLTKKIIKQKPGRFSREISFIKEISKSDSYLKWKNKKQNKITKSDICDMLHGTLNTSEKKLEDNLKRFIGYSKIVKEIKEHQKESVSVFNFLFFVKSNWEELLDGKTMD